ncbi:MAG TPA: short-chain dehydrogenase, partial [Acidimicrobiaceae bacterium]|nr:short-chain dehydrogenase [Acidimicrobiaceae bacterium]
VAIVTGSGGGIGEAYARALHAEGARVVIAELDAERGQAVADDLGEGALFVPTDVGDPASTDAMATATVDAFGRIDHLVNN